MTLKLRENHPEIIFINKRYLDNGCIERESSTL